MLCSVKLVWKWDVESIALILSKCTIIVPIGIIATTEYAIKCAMAHVCVWADALDNLHDFVSSIFLVPTKPIYTEWHNYKSKQDEECGKK